MTRNTSIECGGCGSRDVTYTASLGFRCESCGQHEERQHQFLSAPLASREAQDRKADAA